MNAYEITKKKLTELDIHYNSEELERSNVIFLNQSIGDSGVQGGILIFFAKDSKVFDLYIQNFASVEIGTSQVTRMIEICNEFNRDVGYAKMYVDEDGKVRVQLKKDYEEFDVEDLIGWVALLLEILEKDYITRLMKVKWS